MTNADRAEGAVGRSRRRRRAALAALAGVAVVGMGCGGDSGGSTTATTTGTGRTVDRQQVEEGIQSSLSTSSVRVTNAKCPADVPVKAGDTFTCSVTFSNDATGKVTVTQQGAGRYAYALEEGSVQIPGESVDAAIEKSLAAQGIANATVTCPENIVVKVGTTVTCDVSGAQGLAAGTVTFSFSTAEGAVDPSSVTTG